MKVSIINKVYQVLGLLDRVRLTLRGGFGNVSSTNRAAVSVSPDLHHSKVINFLWLRNKPQPRDDLSNALPEKYANNILETARLNPDCSVVLWVDEGHWNEPARQKLSDLCRNTELPNLTLGSLRTITTYRTNMLFAKEHRRFLGDHTDPIWQKVDFARVIVLNHLLKTTDAEQVFYADVDLIVPPISSQAVQNVMQQHGMVFTRNPKESVGSGFLENGFMGFRRESADFVSDKLVPMTLNAISNGMDGWQPMCQAAREKVGKGGNWLDGITVPTKEIH